MAAPAATAKVLLGHFSSVVLTRINLDKLNHLAFLRHHLLAFRKRNPQEGDQQERYLSHNTTHTNKEGDGLQKRGQMGRGVVYRGQKTSIEKGQR
jgi:hypothetical protein